MVHEIFKTCDVKKKKKGLVLSIFFKFIHANKFSNNPNLRVRKNLF